MSKPLPKMRRGAVSASIEGAYHAVWNNPSAMNAYETAESECLKLADECTTLASRGWIVAGNCERVSYFTTNGTKYEKTSHAVFIKPGMTQEEALEGFFQEAANSDYSRSHCKILAMIAGDGSHE
jgi:hypothetical protein